MMKSILKLIFSATLLILPAAVTSAQQSAVAPGCPDLASLKPLPSATEKTAARIESDKLVAEGGASTNILNHGLGDKDKGFEWLEKDFSNKTDLGPIKGQIVFESLRDDPRFKDVLKRMNLPD